MASDASRPTHLSVSAAKSAENPTQEERGATLATYRPLPFEEELSENTSFFERWKAEAESLSLPQCSTTRPGDSTFSIDATCVVLSQALRTSDYALRRCLADVEHLKKQVSDLQSQLGSLRGEMERH